MYVIGMKKYLRNVAEFLSILMFVETGALLV
jgi:hypothetical protein